MQTEPELVRTAIQGVGISLSVALVVLIFSTTNAIVGALAALSMTCIIVVVLGTFVAVGWSLGITESVAVSYVRRCYPEQCACIALHCTVPITINLRLLLRADSHPRWIHR